MNRLTSREGKTWPGYAFGGRMRTSTLVLIIAFLGVGWLYETYEPPAGEPQQIPASEVVPPGFIPDPNYTWAPRTDVQRHNPTTTTEPTTTTSSTPTTTVESSAPLTPGEPTTSSSAAPAPSTSASRTPAPVPSTTASVVPTASERPVAPSTGPAVPAGGAAPTTEPLTR